jgi:hypothetical protein
MIRVTKSGASFDEMHVDGGTTSPLFIAPELANLLPAKGALLEGANVYIIVNGQIGTQVLTTPIKTTPIVRRSIEAALNGNALEAVEIAWSLAQRNGMQLRITEIPNDYPYRGPLDVQPVRMKALFDYGVRCAQQQELWTTSLELLDRIERSRLGSVGATVQCPG